MARALRARWRRLVEWTSDRYHLVALIEVPEISGGDDPIVPIAGPALAYRATLARRRR